MAYVIVTGSCGLIGSETVRFFCEKGFNVIGIDNDMRKYFFGEEASTNSVKKLLTSSYDNYFHHSIDIRNTAKIETIFEEFNKDIELIIHSAAQPSHDWAAREPTTDFNINAIGTLNMLEATRKYSPEAVFIFISTNKVYGDHPNRLPLTELETRWEIDYKHPYYEKGIDESMSLDQCKHSIFGASKTAADILTQEYGLYFGIKTGTMRCGCLTGPQHAGAELHGFLAYLIKCVVTKKEYRIFGYKGKQVRDNLHCYDIVNAFYHFYQDPRPGEVYNIGGSRFSNCSMMEAIKLCEDISGKKMNLSYVDTNRIGDHIWWISDISKFKNHYPEWRLTKSIHDILIEIFENNVHRWL